MESADEKYSASGSVELIDDEQNDRDRSRRINRFSDGGEDAGDVIRDRSQDSNRIVTRVYVSNIPYDVKWQSIKDLFRQEVGEVEFVELFFDERVKPRGCGIIEFKTPELVAKALGKMNKYEMNGRKIVVVEDYGHERDKYGRILRNSGQKNSQPPMRQRDRSHDRPPVRSNFGGSTGSGINEYSGPINTFGLSASFLNSLGIEGPLHPRIFIANLDYKVDSKKLEQVFRLAGRIYNLDLSTDKDGNSRGFAVIEYEHPVEAVQAIAMFDQQMLYDRRMTVRLDRVPDKGEGIKLPDGLRSIGIGLGPNGEPLKDIPRNLPNIQQNLNHSIPQSLNSMIGGVVGGGIGSLPNSCLGSNLAALTNVVGGLSNPILSSAANLGFGLNSNNNKNDNISSNASYTDYAGGAGTSRDFEFAGNSSIRNYNTSSSRDDFSRSGGTNLVSNNVNNSRKSNTIVISNLPTTCTWQTLRDKLRDIGEIVFAEVRGQDKGIVRFADERDAELAIKCLDGSRFENRVVEANYF